MSNSRFIELGYISACIAGDYRYMSRLSVKVDGPKVHVVLEENGAVGGMDGPGGATPMRETGRRTVGRNAPEIVKEIKSLMDDTIKRYGKPSKEFSWLHGQRGLSVAKCKEALAKVERY